MSQSPADGEGSTADEVAEILEQELTSLEGELAGDTGLAGDVDLLMRDLQERTADLQRLHAEYQNYRKRVERDREAVRDAAVASALVELLPVLDDIGRAREHDELDGAFKVVGEALESVATRLGLEGFGAPGEPFDPTVHEAIAQESSPEVETTTCITVFQQGYRYKDRIVRPARVVVAEPETSAE